MGPFSDQKSLGPEALSPVLFPGATSTARRKIAELVATGQSTIIIPTVFRDDYLQALRALTRRHRPSPFVQAMIRAQRFSCLEFSPYPSVLRELTRCHWFREPHEARIVEGPL